MVNNTHSRPLALLAALALFGLALVAAAPSASARVAPTQEEIVGSGGGACAGLGDDITCWGAHLDRFICVGIYAYDTGHCTGVQS
jgi:hypothetical protein